MCLVLTSIFLQLIIFVLSGVLANNNLADKRKCNKLNIINNIVLILTGLLMGVNICVNVFVQIDFTAIFNKNRTLFDGADSPPSVFSLFDARTNAPTTPIMSIPDEYWSSSSTPFTTPSVTNN